MFAKIQIKQRITKVKYDWVKFYYVSNRGA